MIKLCWIKEEGNVVFNDAINTFYLRLYGVRYMAKDHSDSERGNPLPPRKLLFPISSKGLLYASYHRQDNTYHGFCYNSRGALAGTINGSMGPPWRINPWANALTTQLHLAPQQKECVEVYYRRMFRFKGNNSDSESLQMGSWLKYRPRLLILYFTQYHFVSV